MVERVPFRKRCADASARRLERRATGRLRQGPIYIGGIRSRTRNKRLASSNTPASPQVPFRSLDGEQRCENSANAAAGQRRSTVSPSAWRRLFRLLARKSGGKEYGGLSPAREAGAWRYREGECRLQLRPCPPPHRTANARLLHVYQALCAHSCRAVRSGPAWAQPSLARGAQPGAGPQACLALAATPFAFQLCHRLVCRSPLRRLSEAGGVRELFAGGLAPRLVTLPRLCFFCLLALIQLNG